jgi:hypothetical protein
MCSTFKALFLQLLGHQMFSGPSTSLPSPERIPADAVRVRLTLRLVASRQCPQDVAPESVFGHELQLFESFLTDSSAGVWGLKESKFSDFLFAVIDAQGRLAVASLKQTFIDDNLAKLARGWTTSLAEFPDADSGNVCLITI